MRVITGKYRGRKLFSPLDNRVRPTTDRIKETVFNVLSAKSDFCDARVLDLFAGTGALGIEALSRGASACVFVDKDSDSIRLIRQNLSFVQEKTSVFQTDFRVALKKMEGNAFDFIFLDPPYADGMENEIIERIHLGGVLSKSGYIFIEHSTENKLINLPECFIIDTRKCGNTAISFVSYGAEKDDGEE